MPFKIDHARVLAQKPSLFIIPESLLLDWLQIVYSHIDLSFRNHQVLYRCGSYCSSSLMCMRNTIIFFPSPQDRNFLHVVT